MLYWDHWSVWLVIASWISVLYYGARLIIHVTLRRWGRE